MDLPPILTAVKRVPVLVRPDAGTAQISVSLRELLETVSWISTQQGRKAGTETSNCYAE